MMNRADMQKRVAELGPWFHNLDLDGVPTAPAHFLGDYPRQKWRHFAHAVPSDLTGKTILDVGCNAGFYTQRGSPNVAPLARDYPFEERSIFDRSDYPKMHFVEHRYAHDDTNWWIPNRACVEAMLRSAGFHIESRPEEEVYVCKAEGGAQ